MPRPPEPLVNLALMLIPPVLLIHAATVLGVLWFVLQGGSFAQIFQWLVGAGVTFTLFGALLATGLLPASEGS